MSENSMLDTIEEHTNLGVWYLDLITMDFTVSDKIREMYGIANGTYEQLLNDFTLVEDRTILEQTRLKLMNGETPVLLQYRMIDQTTGEIKKVESTCYRVENDKKELVGFKGVTRLLPKRGRKKKEE